jgi:ketosteroid isomerase-like protein
MLRNFWLCNCMEERSMALDVPKPLAEYLAAEEVKDADALSRCFTEDGTVHDERQDYHGRDSIRQ